MWRCLWKGFRLQILHILSSEKFFSFFRVSTYSILKLGLFGILKLVFATKVSLTLVFQINQAYDSKLIQFYLLQSMFTPKWIWKSSSYCLQRWNLYNWITKLSRIQLWICTKWSDLSSNSFIQCHKSIYKHWSPDNWRLHTPSDYCHWSWGQSPSSIRWR